MFGRSGQMFPRRTFHDAIYEEEYGSDNEDECCRCRGLSAILCWFLSVIILVGLAATVVLTVFFILRSRTLMVKPDVDVDVELYGKDQNLYESKGGGGGTSKELLGSNEVTTSSSSPKRKKSNTKGSGRGPPDATKNDVDADVNEDQNAINDNSDQEEDIAEDASVNHPHNQHPNHHTHHQHNRNRLQPYSPVKTTTTTSTTTTTTEAPPAAAEQSEEENNQNESSSEEETDTEQNNGEGSSLFNLFSGPRNPSYSTPSQNEDEDEEEEDADDDGNNEDDDVNQLNANDAASNGEYGNKVTRYQDGAPIQQVLFTESPKVTVTTPSPYGNRRNLQTTRISTGRTSFTSTTTTAMPPSEESEEEEDDKNEEDSQGGKVEENEEVDNEENDQSSEEEKESVPVVSSTPQTTTSMYDDGTGGKDGSEVGSRESGESQLKQMLLDSIPPHGANKDDDEGGAKEEDEEESGDDEEMGGMSSSSEFNLSQKVTTTAQPSTTSTKPLKTTKPTKQRGSGDTISRLISRNFTRKTTSTTTETSATSGETESQTERPSTATTIGPAGHKYDYTMTPNHRTKLKVKSTESVEQEAVTSTTKPPPKFTLKQRFRSTTLKPAGGVTPEPPSTAAPRTRGTTPPATSKEYGIKLGGKRGSVESPIDIVPSPDLSPKGQLKQQIQRLKEQQQRKQQQQQQPNSFEGVDLNSASTEDQSKTSSEQQFLDVLVGADDQKTLVTKKTEDGIVTSVILPPWYDSNGANSSISDVLATNGTTLSNIVAKVPTNADEEDGQTSGENSFGEKTTIGKKKSSEEKSALALSKEDQHGPSEFERLVNMFSKQEASSEEIPAPPTTNRFGYKKQKPIVLKKPGGSLNSRYIPKVPGRAGLFPSSAETKSTENKSNGGESSPSPASPEADATTTNIERPPGDVGRTGVLPTAADVEEAVANAGYYSEHGEDHDKGLEHQMGESDRLKSDETMDSTEDEEQENPSHVIDVNIEEPGDNPEIIIEQDSSAPVEDEDGDFVEDEDYGAYGENPPTLAMSGSTPNEKIVPAPEDYVLRGSGIRRPVSSEETTDLEESASAPVKNNATATGTSNVSSTPSPVAAIRRPAYTREEIAKSSVKPSPESLDENHLNENLGNHRVPAGSVEEEFEDEYEDEDNYEGGSIEQHPGGGSLEQWSSERIGVGSQRWSAPDKIMDAVTGHEAAVVQTPRPTLSEELTEPDELNESAESSVLPTVEQSPINTLDDGQRDQTDNSTAVFRPPPLVSFHENKLSFSPPAQAEGEYHSKDGWRPVISNSATSGTSMEPASGQAGSYEPEEPEDNVEPQQEQLYQEPSMPQQEPPTAPVSPIQVKLPPQQKWAQEQPPQQPWAQEQMIHPPPPPQQIKHNSIIPPPVPATVKFPDSEEDHEDRRHHGRRRVRPGQQGQFDRAKYMVRPVPPPIVMRRRPHSNGPYPPPPGHNTRQGPPPPHQRPPPPQMMQQAASQQNPQYAEPPPPQARPSHPPINRNFHIRPNPMRRFNFGGGGGPPLAQPRSGGNIKWPTDDGEVSRGDSSNNSQDQNIEGAQSEVSVNKRRRRKRRAPVLAA